MTNKLLARAGFVALSGVLAVSLAACGSSPTPTASDSAAAGGEVKGGTITYLNVAGAYDGTDPATIYLGIELASFRRLVYRGLTALPITDDPNPSVVADAATDTGTTPDSGKTWTFTIKDGIKWQDGTPVTAEDF